MHDMETAKIIGKHEQYKCGSCGKANVMIDKTNDGTTRFNFKNGAEFDGGLIRCGYCGAIQTSDKR